ncbi:Ig-like domain repeat protein [Isoptericola sp. NPDC057559]|uniref:Ig-like domain repeat protein n=1 Tax=Isoptericola sp. NPDC057559 TaxID=3346168 RepID=UPI00369FFB1C
MRTSLHPFHGRRSRALVIGLVSTALVLTLAPGATATPKLAAGADAEPAVSGFVPDGVPVARGGSVAQLGPFDPVGPSYAMSTEPAAYPEFMPEAPEGDDDVALFGSYGHVGTVRASGTVAQLDSSSSWATNLLHGVPQEATLVQVAANRRGGAFGVTSTGALVSNYWEWDQILPADPDGSGFVGVTAGDDVQYAVRGDGRLVGFAKPEHGDLLACAPAWQPEPGTAYATVSARGSAWSALRSDGAVVTCGYDGESAARVIVPEAGDEFVGTDAGGRYALAVTARGRVVSLGDGLGDPLQPHGDRTVVGLSAGDETAVVVLDDGTVLQWGAQLALPGLPGGNLGFAAVAEQADGRTYGIWRGPLSAADVTAEAPAAVRHGSDIGIDVHVTLGGEPAPDGRLCVKEVEGWAEPTCTTAISGGAAHVDFPTFDPSVQTLPGPRRLLVAYVSPVTRASWAEVDVEVLPKAVTTLEVDGPAEWRRGDRTALTVRLGVEDDTVPVGGLVLRAIVGQDDAELGYTDDDVVLGVAELDGVREAVVDIDTAPLPPGDYDYVVSWEPREENPTAATSLRARATVRGIPVNLVVTPSDPDWRVVRGTELELVVWAASSRGGPLDGAYTVLVDGSVVDDGWATGDGPVRVVVPTSPLSPGSHALEVRFDPTDRGAPPYFDRKTWTGRLAVVVPPQVSATAPGGAWTYGRAHTVAVRVAAPGVTTAGVVEVYRGSSKVGSATVSRGVASVSVSGRAIPVGSSQLTVKYLGSSTVAAGTTTLPVTVGRATPTASVSVVGTPWRYGQGHSLRVHVAASGVTPTGPVVVYRGSSKVGSATLRDGWATVRVGGKSLPVGSRTLSVRYLGSSTVASRRVERPVTVRKAVATASVRLVDDRVRRPARAKVVVTVASPSDVTVRGRVAVQVDGRTVATVRLTAGDVGRARATLPAGVAPGKHTVRAVYLGTSTTVRDTSRSRVLTILRAR